MKYFLVQHGANDYRLHQNDGTETGDSWSNEPTPVDVMTAVGVDRGLSQANANALAQLIVNGYAFRQADNTPW